MKKVKYPGLVGEIARRGDTQETLAKLLGLSTAAICRKFSGQREWSISEIEKICDYYNKDYYELFK